MYCIVLMVTVEYVSVVLLCLEIEDKARFMYLAQQRGMTTGDYVYLTFKLLPDIAQDFAPWVYTPEVQPEDMETVKEAYYTYKQART